MYWKYCVRRILNGIVIYAILIFIFSTIFNATMEQTLISRIEEKVRAEMMSLDTRMTPEEVNRYIIERKADIYRLYHLDEPSWKRVIWRATNSLTFNFGRSTIIRSSAGETDVRTIVTECIPRTIILFTAAVAINILLGLWLGLKKAQRAGGGNG